MTTTETTAALSRDLRVIADLLDLYGRDPDEVHALAGRVEALARELRERVRRLDRAAG